jgi:hypothetical protein
MNSKDAQLKDKFLLLLEEIDTGFKDRSGFAKEIYTGFKDRSGFAEEFAERLVNFTKAWATRPDSIDEFERELEGWIKSIGTRPQPDIDISWD